MKIADDDPVLNIQRMITARERVGLTQVELSEELGLNKGAVSQWERGTRLPSVPALKRYARRLRVSLDWLASSDDSDTVPQPTLDALTVEDIRRDRNAPLGLKDLANDAVTVEALTPTEEEWAALRSLSFRDGMTREGYITVLMALRAMSIDAKRRASREIPGRRLGSKNLQKKTD